jgi:23S rRNA pseudouridine2605 synthase
MSERRPRRDEARALEGEPLRLQAFLARAGVASRRASEELIATGRVSVNGHTVTTQGTKVRPGVDRVAVDGMDVAPSETLWVALHKPKGYVTTRTDPYGRKTIYELLPDRFHALFHVGRLDRDSEGLLLLTNDGDTANKLLHPRYGTTKEYLVDVEGKLGNDAQRRLLEGVELEDGVATAEEVTRLHQTDVNTFRVRVVLREGKKREVRRMMDAVGHPVVRLMRRRFGPVELGELPEGKWRVLSPNELASVGESPAPPRRPRPK